MIAPESCSEVQTRAPLVGETAVCSAKTKRMHQLLFLSRRIPFRQGKSRAARMKAKLGHETVSPPYKNYTATKYVLRTASRQLFPVMLNDKGDVNKESRLRKWRAYSFCARATSCAIASASEAMSEYFRLMLASAWPNQRGLLYV